MEVKQAHDTLRWLFTKYLENPEGQWNILSCMEEGGAAEAQRLGSFLVRKGYVRDHAASDNGFFCTITMLGINQVSDEFSDVKFRILEASIEHKKNSLTEILAAEPGHFKRVKDYATYLKRLGIIECIFHHNDVFAEPTFFGREWYNENKPRFVN